MSTTYRLRDGLTLRELPDGDAVVAGSSNDAVIVNATASALLGLLDGKRSVADLTEVLHAAFRDEDRAKIEQDVTALLLELQQARIIERCGNAPSNV